MRVDTRSGKGNTTAVAVPLSLMLFSLCASSAFADCAQPVSLEDWRSGVAKAESVWARLDLEGFRSATDSLATRFPCVVGQLTPGDAASLHRIQGLRADVVGTDELAVLAFLAARRLDSDWRFPDFLPEQHPLRLLYARLPLDGVTMATMARPRSGKVLVDGVLTRERARGIPAVVQWLTSEGSVGWSGYLQGDEDVAGYPRATKPRALGWSLVGVATASALASAASLVVSADARAQYDDLSTPANELDGLRATTNTGFWVGVGTGVGAAGSVVAAAVVLRM